MAIASVTATINGVAHNLTYNASSGLWEATLTAPSGSSFNKAGGYYDVALSARDNAGNTASANASTSGVGASLRLVVKEKVPPTVQILSPGAGSYLITAAPVITAQLRDDDSGIKISTLALRIDGGSAIGNTAVGMVCTAVSGGYDIRYTPQAALSDGSHTVTVDVQDNDGNAAVRVSRSFTVDTVAPILNVISPADGLLTNKTAGTVSGTTSDATSGPASVVITVNGVDAGAVAIGEGGAFSRSVTYREGVNTVVVTATDLAGKSTTVTRKVEIDTTPPNFASVELVPNPVDAGKTYVIRVQVV